ncbi:MAG TPA: YiiX/YebB-like N1pC/P60 family cysteine hydrolase [Gammaproteobacteria bacterium]|jgi:hypothetical protein|nr:YiiX/YebB-like N1pC/P60 family cysteine hydrolase [Gammaproteobacteria bacterium]
MRFYESMKKKLTQWLIYEPPVAEMMPYDFNRLKYEIRPGDVLLIEGRSRISKVINMITHSPWTHAALYIGRLRDIEDPEMLRAIHHHIDAKSNKHLIIESMLDRGNLIAPLETYQHQHIRICRPIGITQNDSMQVIKYAISSLGQRYNVRQLFDLGRFLLPWSILPRRWGSSLFRTATGEPESGICSSLIAEAFASVQFPILPYVISNEAGVAVHESNPFLITPKDFDYSPYFEIIKYPLFNPDEPLPYYRRMPWTKIGFSRKDSGT